MKRSKKVFIIAACLFLAVVVGGSMYVYNQIEHILTAKSLPQLLQNSSQDKLSTFSAPKAPENNLNIPSPGIINEQQANTEVSNAGENVVNAQPNTQQTKPARSSNSNPAENPALSNKVISTLEKEAGRPVDTSDILKAGYILMSKLNNDEINFLMGFSDKKYTVEELKELRKLLLSKLSEQDIETLRALADKYDRNLYILDPNVPIK